MITAAQFGGQRAESGTRCGACGKRAIWLYPLLLPKGTIDYPEADGPVETSIRVCASCYREAVELLADWLLRHAERMLRRGRRRKRAARLSVS